MRNIAILLLIALWMTPIIASAKCTSDAAVVAAAFFRQTSINLNVTPVTVARATVVCEHTSNGWRGYALQPWSTTNGGGAALLQYDSSRGWVFKSGGGGVWDVPSLIIFHVPKSIAEKLIAGTRSQH